MKQNIHHLYYLFYPRSWIIITLFIFSASAIAQESTPEEFIIGSSLSGKEERRTDPRYYNSFDTSGMNTIQQYADESTLNRLNPYNLVAINHDVGDWISYYSTCYYSSWEAEQNQTELNRVGVKHNGGAIAYWDTAWCWSTRNVISTAPSLIYGPDYRQDNRYKNWAHGDRWDVRYYPRFRMGLENQRNADPEIEVCRIKVVYRYRKWDSENTYGDSVCIFREKTLTVGDFPQDGQLKYFSFNYPNDYYKYPPQFLLPDYAGKIDPDYEDEYPKYEDSYSFQGIQFVVDWLVDSNEESGLTLYVDHIEVFDGHWKLYFVDRDPEISANQIRNYANNYSEWDNLRYWYGHDEPYSIDAFMPIRIVDSILYHNPSMPDKQRHISMFNPYWTWDDSRINGDTLLCQYYRMVKPEKLWIDFYPFSPLYPFRYDDAEALRSRFQLCHTLQPGFWYQGQGGGEYIFKNGAWEPWVVRYPESSELKASVMLALAHGSKGITFWTYDTWEVWGYGDPYLHKIKGLVEEDEQLTPTPLWYLIRDDLTPRLKGTLGNTLLNLDYTGNFIRIVKEPIQPDGDFPPTYGYLSLSCTQPFYHFHAGFFHRKNLIDDTYFMLVNIKGTSPVTITIMNNFGCSNLKIKYVENPTLLDTTISGQFIKDIPMPPGEGYLFEVGPVVKYGGKLIYDETISSTTTLHDEMVIQNNAILTVNSTYNVYADIRVKAGGRIVTTGNGKLNFYQGHKLIIEGNAILNGTVSNKLKLDFTNPINSNGIIIKPGGSLSISYCEIKNAVKGITSELNLYSLNIQNVDFVDCDSVAAFIIGRNRLLDELTLTPPPPQIKYCNIINSDFGILVSNLSQIVIQQNTLTGTDLAISLSNVTTPSIINNTLTGTSEMPGIFLESCNGVVRGNSISGHTNGITFGNSSPDVGGNVVEHNWNRGFYVGSGSLPNLRGKLVQDPIHPNIFYAVSGYNKINENGGWEIEDDGSEIFINDANAILGDEKTYGCNEITDQRIPNTEDTPPLYNTQLLMNCIWSGHPQVVHAEGNFWNEHPIYRLEERFGDCNNIYLDPILSEPCPLPDGSDGKLLITSSTGETIDTLYAEERTIGTLTETEQLYATAEEKFLTSDFEDAEIIYNQIISGNDSLVLKLDSYRRLFEIGKFLGRDEEYFSGLRDIYLSLAGSAEDTLLIKIFNQLSSLSLVANQEYVPAINEFDEIIQQNPNTEEAVFAEIDALTTALMVGDGDSTLQKGTLGKYLIKSSADYNSKLDGILRKHFGNGEKESDKEVLPTEYTLYQNYPNPFNPTTTIKYDLPFTADVSLIIYDILGRKVKELLNTKQQAGRYEVQFNATNIASGVYIYQLISEKYINSKKMILLK